MQDKFKMDKDKSFSDEEDTLPSLCKKGNIVKTLDNFSFAARLILFKDDEIWLENKRGQKWMVNRQNLLEVKPLGKVI
jgi:hypothetical protein